MVSDVLNHDIDFTLQFLNDYSTEFVDRFKNHIKENRLIFINTLLFNHSFTFFGQLPNYKNN